MGGFPIDQHRVDDGVACKSILARCVDRGLATPSPIAGPGGVSVRTVRRAVRQRHEQGWDGFGRMPSRNGRSVAVQDGRLVQRAANLLRTGTSVRGVGLKLGLSCQELRNCMAAGPLPGLPGQAPPADSARTLPFLLLSDYGPAPGRDELRRSLRDSPELNSP